MQEFQYNYIKEWTKIFHDWSLNSLFPVHLSGDVCFVLACQSALESGYGTSVVFAQNFNLFGMRVPRVRYNLVVSEKFNHASYESYYTSFCDMVIWLLYNKFPVGCFYHTDEFLVRLQNSLFNSSKFYASSIRNIMNSYYKYESLLKPKDHEKEASSSENSLLPF